jgi:rhomboid protease GluP
LTTRRVYWPGPSRRTAADGNDAERARPAGRAVPPPRCAWAAYGALPERINAPQAGVVDLGPRGQIRLEAGRGAAEALVGFLNEARDRVRGDSSLPELPFAARDQARHAWPDVLRANYVAREIQARVRGQRSVVREFQRQTLVAGRAVVTPLLAAACVGVFVAMVLTGISPVAPAGAAILRWGALASPLVVGGETWRLVTCLFLHFGVLHLGLNVWGLWVIGRAVERFYGHLGFAALYLLSGLGGALASLYTHPVGICAGASGAIFGLIGGLLAFLAVRHRDFPAAIFRPMRSGALSFIAINLVVSASSPSIDMAGHLGGLATGFLAGLALSPRAVTRPGRAGLLVRCLVIAALAGALAGAGRVTIAATRTRLQTDDAARAFVAFQLAGRPVFERVDRTSRSLSALVKALEEGRTAPPRLLAEIDGLIADTRKNAEDVRALPAGNDELRAMVAQLVAAQGHLRGALELVRRAVETGDQATLEGPDGFDPRVERFFAAQKEYLRLRAAGLRRYGLDEERPEDEREPGALRSRTD